MNPTPRLLIAAALLVLLAACGNKGPLLRASDVPPAQPQVESAPVESSPATAPTAPAHPVEIAPPPAADPASATAPEVLPEASPADDAGNG